MITNDIILYNYALSFLGTPYKWGGDDPMEGIDCSGLVIELLKAAGVLPREYDSTADGLAKKFNSPLLPLCQFGALIFYGSQEKITHVAFALSEFLCIEAGGGGSRVVDHASASKYNAFVRIRPCLTRSDVVSVVMPKYPWR